MVPCGYVGISGNEIADKLTTATSSFLCIPFLKTLCSDILPYLRESLLQVWQVNDLHSLLISPSGIVKYLHLSFSILDSEYQPFTIHYCVFFETMFGT